MRTPTPTLTMPFTQTPLSLLVLVYFSIIVAVHSLALVKSPPYATPSDAVSLLLFKSKADLDNKLLYIQNEPLDYCEWRGVKCAQGRVVRIDLHGFGLRGEFAPDTLTHLGQLRILSLNNNSLSGPIPDLSRLAYLKSLFLDHNSFSGSFPPSILLIHSLEYLDLSYNNLTGSIPVEITVLDRLISLQLDWNRFNGTVPPLNQTYLKKFDVSGNNLTGQIPLTPTLSRFNTPSFESNPSLCGEIINKACNSRSRFFDSPKSNDTSTSTTAPLGQSAQAQSQDENKHKTSFTTPENPKLDAAANAQPPNPTSETQEPERNRELLQQQAANANKSHELRTVQKSGNLMFCGGEAQLYNMDQLMRASAELLGRGTVATTYKAVLDNQLILTVKRLDSNKTTITTSQFFDHHMNAVGRLRHPNLVPIKAYFQANGERLVIYDYQPNGSLFSLIHVNQACFGIKLENHTLFHQFPTGGSRSTRAKSLHWTSCLKIAEDVAQGLAYIHQASRLIHGNLKSSNVLLGPDFEACVTDYCLALLADSSNGDPDSAGYKAPEIRRSNSRATSKSDVYAFGILLLELLTSKHPSQHPFLVPTDVPNWVRAMREDDSGEDNRLGMLTEVACICSVTSPEQRPAMWQVLKMIQEIKESVTVDNTSHEYSS
uniref:Protein kinase domain-containing protein n=1 Tax=Fagus sylvatica TaxID=28930 RepID=A0A2N9FEU0_FAGSY